MLPTQMPIPPTLLIRADASSEVGYGHVMRCLALAQAWRRRGGRARWICAALPPGLLRRLADEGFAVRRIDARAGSTADQRATLAEWARHSRAALCLDGYALDADYLEACYRARRGPLLVVDDDLNRRHYPCTHLLNVHPEATEALYASKLPAGAQQLVGADYILLREEFLRAARRATVPDTPSTLLVTLGGTKQPEALRSIADAFQKSPWATGGRLVMLAGADAEEAAVASIPQMLERAEILSRVDDMPALLGRADAAVCGAGGTVWELLYLGVPMACVQVAENQRANYRFLMERRLALGLGEAPTAEGLRQALTALFSAESRRELQPRGLALVDGQGADRVVQALFSRLAAAEPRAVSDDAAASISLRRATRDDARFYFEVNNHPSVRAQAIHGESIRWASHVAWFTRRLEDTQSALWVGEAEGRAVATLRADLSPSATPGEGTTAVLAIALSPDARGRGLGRQIIRQGTEELLKTSGVERVVAYIRPANEASQRAFIAAGFRPDGEARQANVDLLRFVRTSDGD